MGAVDVAKEEEEPPAGSTAGALGAAASAELRARYACMVEGLLAISAEVDSRLRKLEEKEVWWSALERQMHTNATAAKSKIDLNVGGQVFTTSRSTMLRHEGTYFHALLSSGKWEPCDDGAYFIDRDPGLFGRIMEALRSGDPVDAEGLQERQLAKLNVELDYYQLPSALSPGGAPARIPDPAESPCVRWDHVTCNPSLTVSEAGRVITKTGHGSGCCAAIATLPDVSKFAVRIWNRGGDGDIAIGYVESKTFSRDMPNHNRSGWFLYLSSGDLWSGRGDRGRAYCGPLNQGDLLEVLYDKAAGHISFSVNGSLLGVAFTDVTSSEALVPCVDMYEPGASVAIED